MDRDVVQEDREILHYMASDVNNSKRDQLRRDIRTWLSPPDPWKNYNDALGLRYSGTATWFVQGDTFSEWKASGPSSLLWIHGKPGAGKSVLCSTIIEELNTMRKSGLASLAMFYYDFKEDGKKDLRGLLSSFLFQLSDQSKSYYDILSIFYSTHRDGAQSPSNDELVRCLKNLLNLPGQVPVYLIVDALDECPSTSSLTSPREAVLSLLEDLIDLQLPNLRICITSRPEADIKPVLEPLTFRSVSLHEERGHMEDIEKYIKLVVNTNKRMRRWKPEHKQLVIDVLKERADGMFLWVDCQLDYLGDCLPWRIRQALDELPATLDGTYERTLREIKETNWEFARQLLLCVAVASRPLTVNELAQFLAFDFNAGQIPKFREDWCLEDAVDAVLSTCSTLLSLVVVENSQVIQFSHFSVKEFLTSTRFAEKRDTISRRYHVSMTPAHTLVAQGCLGILLHLDENVTKDGLTKSPLAEYAAAHWFVHARFEGVSENVDEGMKLLFDERKPHFGIWLWICDPTVRSRIRRERTERPMSPYGTAVHYAAFCGLYDVIRALVIDRPEDVNSGRFSRGSTPLHLASEEGHVEVARLLVEHGARADAAAQNGGGWTPLHWASSRGHLDMARFLVEHGADVAAQDGVGWTPLHSASSNGHIDVARFLVEHGADGAVKNGRGWTLRLLHWSSSRGHLDMTRLLIENGADAASQDGGGLTPLHWASARGQLDMTRFLLEHGANAASRDGGGSTPLHWASSNGHLDVARFLVEHGASVAAQDRDGWTPLHSASSNGHLDVACFLVRRGASTAAQDTGGSTPLSLASSRGHRVLAQFLIEHGANVAAHTRHWWTQLHWATSQGLLDLVRIFVEGGADVAAQDSDGWTPLHCASSRGQLDMTRLLIEHGADVASQDVGRSTPLHWASSRGHLDVARFLVEHGADTAAQDGGGSTPLSLASSRGHRDLAQFLIEYRTDAAARNGGGRAQLHWASSRGHLDMVRSFVEHGADAAAQDGDGWTPLHWASSFGHLDVARFLVEHGADAAAQNGVGSTPLHGASSRGHLDVARLLVEHGADVAAQDRDGWTPLHSASSSGYLDVAQFLVEHGADTAARNGRGLTPFRLAVSGRHWDLARVLFEHGAYAAVHGRHRSGHR